MKDTIRLAWGSLFLGESPYEEMRGQSVMRGLLLIVLVALVVALLGLVGTTLEWATSPKMSDIQQAVLAGLEDMPWFEIPEAREQFEQWWELSWRFSPQLFGAPNIATAAAQIILLPLRLVVVWFLYALIAHLAARMLGGQGGLGQTLSTTALAVAPQLLNLFAFLPYVVIGGVIGTWTLLSRYVALKTSYQLTWGRALVATLVPYVAFGLVLLLFACLGVAVFGAFVGGAS